MNSKIIGLALVSMITLLLEGCAGARGNLVFDKLEYPVSSSAYLFGPDERMVTVDELVTVGQVVYSKRIWSMFWSFVPLKRTLDVSEPINDQIQHLGGDGVINLRVSVDNCGINYIPILTLLPFYPGCSLVTLTGDIIMFTPSAAPQSLPPPTDQSEVVTNSNVLH